MKVVIGLLVMAAAATTAAEPGTSEVAAQIPEPPPSIFVATTGSDGNRCTQAAPCKTLNHAYNLARPGQVVQVAGGRYPGETVRDQSGAKVAPNVVIRAAAGAAVSFTGRLTLTNVRYLTLRDVVIEPFTDFWPLSVTCAQNVTLENVGGGRRFHLSKAENVTMRGGWWGNYANPGEQDSLVGGGGSDCLPAQPEGPSRNVVLNGVTIRDVYWGKTIPEFGGAHPDCLQMDNVAGLTIRNSRFLRCGQVFLGYYGDGNLSDVLVENNVFAKIGTDTYYSTFFDDGGSSKPGSCANVVFRNNTYDDSGGASSLYAQGYGYPHFACEGGGVRVVGNIFHTGPRRGECSLATWSHNVYERAAAGGFLCGRRAVLARRRDAGFVDRDRDDYRLRFNSRAIDRASLTDYPRFDLRGKRRFAGRAPDAGAYERLRRGS